MPIYELRCGGGHRFEVIQSYAEPLPACPACGEPTRRMPGRIGLLGRAQLPPPPERMPQTWRGTYGANPEYVNELRKTAETRRLLEERHPELAGDRRPIVAHEGRYEGAPLRAGDLIPPAPTHGPGHGHRHGHAGGHGHGRGPSGSPPAPGQQP